MSKEKKLHILIPKMMEVIADKLRQGMETGKFEPFSVRADYPDANSQMWLFLEKDLTDPSGKGCRLRSSMNQKGDSRMVSHYMFKGSPQACIDWLLASDTEAELREDYASLKTRVDDFD